MKIAVIGAGAMGSIYASFLSKNNNEVLVIDIWEEHLEAIKNNGLRVSGFSGDNVVKNINVSSNIGDAKGYETGTGKGVKKVMPGMFLIICLLGSSSNA